MPAKNTPPRNSTTQENSPQPPAPTAEISVRFEQSGLIKGRGALHAATTFILEYCRQDIKLGKIGSIDVLYCSEARIRQLNRDYRGKDESTDVLSFSAEGNTQSFPAQLPEHLGDLAVSLHYVERQAMGNASTLAADVALFLVHGYLHLVGFDHMGAEERRTMFQEQKRLLKGIQAHPDFPGDKLQSMTIIGRETT